MSKRLKEVEGLPYTVDTVPFREALKRIDSGKLGVFPIFDRLRERVSYILLHKNRKKIISACHDFSVPLELIHPDKRSRFGYFYVRLYGYRALKWTEVLRGEKSYRGKSWRGY